MNQRPLFYVITAGLALVVLALVAKIALDRLSAPPWGNPTAGGEPISLAGGTQVGQDFVAPLPGLYRIEVALEPAPGGSGQTVAFHLKEDPSAPQVLWTATLAGDEIGAGALHGFEFPPQRNAQGRRYYFYLEVLEEAPSGAPAVGYNPSAFLDEASAHVNGEPIAGNLHFQTYYTLRTRDKVGVLLSRMAQGRPYMLGTPGFYVVLAVVYGLVLGLFVVQVARAAVGGRGEH